MMELERFNKETLKPELKKLVERPTLSINKKGYFCMSKFLYNTLATENSGGGG